MLSHSQGAAQSFHTQKKPHRDFLSLKVKEKCLHYQSILWNQQYFSHHSLLESCVSFFTNTGISPAHKRRKKKRNGEQSLHYQHILLESVSLLQEELESHRDFSHPLDTHKNRSLHNQPLLQSQCWPFPQTITCCPIFRFLQCLNQKIKS